MAGHIATSSNLDWNTPQWIIDICRKILGGIDLDPCSNPTSKVGAKVNYMLPTNDGLTDTWVVNGRYHTTVFVNPPYGRCYLHKTTRAYMGPKEYKLLSKEEKAQYSVSSVYNWVAKAYDEWRANGVESILLIPAATDTKPWQEIIFRFAGAVAFIKGRVQFEGAVKGPAPMAVALVYFGGDRDTFTASFRYTDSRAYPLNLNDAWTV